MSWHRLEHLSNVRNYLMCLILLSIWIVLPKFILYGKLPVQYTPYLLSLVRRLESILSVQTPLEMKTYFIVALFINYFLFRSISVGKTFRPGPVHNHRPQDRNGFLTIYTDHLCKIIQTLSISSHRQTVITSMNLSVAFPNIPRVPNYWYIHTP